MLFNKLLKNRFLIKVKGYFFKGAGLKFHRNSLLFTFSHSDNYNGDDNS